MTESRTGRQRTGKNSVFHAPLSFILICIAVVFGFSVFFRVSKIEVSGNSRYTEQEIIDAAGIEKGDNLIFMNCFAADSRIFSKLSYVENVSVVRKLPNKVVIEITESKGLAAVTYGGEKWVLAADCKVMEKSDAAGTADLISVTGIEPLAPTLGELLVGGAEEAGKVEYLSKLLAALDEHNMCGDISAVDLSDMDNPRLDYTDRFTVKMGSGDDVEYKIELLMSVVGQLEDGDSGTIDLTESADNKAHFIPD